MHEFIIKNGFISRQNSSVEGDLTSTNLSSGTLTLTAPTGSTPMYVTSKQLITNLNADLLDGYNSSELPFSIPQLEVVNTLVPDYTLRIYRSDVQWDGDWIKIPHGTSVNINKEVKVFSFKASFGYGTVDLDVIVNYPSTSTYSAATYPGFYVKDANNLINKTSDFDYIELQYDVNTTTSNINYDGKYFILGENVVDDESSGQETHSRTVTETFKAIYPEFVNNYNYSVFETVNDPLTNYTSLSNAYQSTYLEIKGANMLTRPYVDGAAIEQSGSNPNIMEVGSHYSNTFARHDITSGSTIFLSNVIAVGARLDDTTTMSGTSYGYGMEFFEDIANLDNDYPLKNANDALAEVLTDTSGTTVYSTVHLNFADSLTVGETITIRYTSDPVTWQNTVVTQKLSSSSILVSPAITPISTGNVYAWYLVTVGDLWNYGQQQSASTPIVAAKLKKIKLETGTNWKIVREAARATASNSVVSGDTWVTNWDMYRGFGKIRPDLAIQYIKDNYTENPTYIAELSDELEGLRGINSLLKYTDLLPNSPVSKKMIGDNIYLKTESDSRYVNATGDTMTGNLNVNGNLTTVSLSITNLTDGYIPYHQTDNNGFVNSGLYWDNSTNRLGIGNTIPSQKLDLVGNAKVSGQFISTVTGSTAPLSVQSTTVVSNLNADLLDGQHGSYYQAASTAINTSNIGSQSVSYATTADTLDGFHAAYFQPISTAINTSNIGSQSVSYATTSGNANLLDNKNTSDDVTLGGTSASNNLIPSQLAIKTYDDARWIDINRRGFVNRAETTISFDPVTYIFTLSPVSSTWRYLKGGIEYTVTGSKTIQIANPPVDGQKYYITILDGIGTLGVSTNVWDIEENPVAVVKFISTATPKYLMFDERHTCLFDTHIHKYLHNTQGTQYITGGELTGYTIENNTNASNTFAITQSVIADEDIYLTLPGLSDGNGLNSTNYLITYRAGSTYTWQYSPVPFLYTTNGYINWDNAGVLTQGSGGAGSSIRYYNTYLFFTNEVSLGRYIIVTGQNEYATDVDAYDEQLSDLDLTNFGIVEWVAMYQLTWRTGLASLTNLGKVQLSRPPHLIKTSLVTAAQTTNVSHNSLDGLQGGDNINLNYYHLNEIDFGYATDLSVLSTGYLPYKSSTDISNSNVYFDGTNVGIGTASPGAYKLDVNGSIRTQTGYIVGANNQADITLDGTLGSQLRYGNQKVLLNAGNAYIYTNNIERIFVGNDGNVGVGTTSPGAYKLNVNGNTYINGNLQIVGDIYQSGSTYETHAEQIYTKDNLIVLRDGAVSGLNTGEYAGFTAKLYDGVNDGQLVFDKDGWARVGDVGSLQKIATIEETTTDGYFMVYDGTNKRLHGVSSGSTSVNYATSAGNADTLDGQHGSYYQPVSTAINTSNIGSQSVSYATTAGNADTLDGQHGSYYQAASTAINTSNIGSQSVSYATTADTLDGFHAAYFQPISTAINTSNIGSQSVSYATTSGNADTLDGQHGSYYYAASNPNSYITSSGVTYTNLNANGSVGTGSNQVAVGNHNHSGVYQPLDADLTAIAALAGTTGLLKKTAADTWTLDTTAYTTNTGTVTSISTTAPLSGGTITTSGTISLAANYGDTQNPYASKTANYFLAAPNGAAGSPVFRAIVAADIPTLNQSTTGNAGTATVLQTARTINGTSFDGSANITTASWGTTRTLTIGSTGKSVDGSTNISWSLAEIGAAESSHTHSYLPLSGGTLTGQLLGPSAVFGSNLSYGTTINDTGVVFNNYQQSVPATYPSPSKGFTWNITSDGAWMKVYERGSDSLEYEFGMRDNIGSPDRFVWKLSEWRGVHAGLESMALYNGTSLDINQSTSLKGKLYLASVGTLMSHALPNRLDNTLGFQGISIIRNNQAYWNPDVGASTLVMTVDASGYTSTTAGAYVIKIKTVGTPNTFCWSNGSTSADVTVPSNWVGNDIPVSTSPITLSNGITISFNATTGGVVNETFGFTALPAGGVVMGNLTASQSLELDASKNIISVAKATAYNQNFTTTATDIKMNGTQSLGSLSAIPRADHVHPTDTSRAATNQTMYIGTTAVAINRTSASLTLTGIASIDGSAATLTTARTLTIGSSGKTFNGSANVSWSLAEIGAQAAGSYQPLDADLTAIAALAGTSGLLKKTAADTWTLDTNTYLIDNQTITLSGVVTGSGTTSITTVMADNALSIAKTSGLQSALDAKLPLSGSSSMTGELKVVVDGRAASFGVNSTAPNTTIANQTNYIQIVANGATESMGLIFHNNTISTSALEYVNTTNDAGYFNFKSDDTTWNVRINNNTVWHAGNDGSTSGLDADLLDGQHGSYYQAASTSLTTSTSFGGDVSGTYNAIVVADNSHNHTSANISDATNTNTANMIVKRDGSGNFSAAEATLTQLRLTGSNTPLITAGGFDSIHFEANTDGAAGSFVFKGGTSGATYATITAGGITATNFSGNASTATVATTANALNASNAYSGVSFNSITGLASATSPMNGTAAVGTSTLVARQDHVHPTDTSRAATNQTMYIGTTAVSINRASAALSLSGVNIDGNAGTVTNGVYTTGSYADPSWITSLSKSKVGLSNVENTALSTWAGSANITTIGAATATSLNVTGNLTVNGTTTTVNSTTVTIDDPILTLGGDTLPTVDDNKDRGIEFKWNNGTTGKTGFFGFDDSTGYFTFIPDATNTSEVFSGTQGDIQASNFRGTLIGSISNAITFNTTGGAAAGTTYNGSTTRTIDYSTVGAAASVHTHSYAGSSSAGGAATSALTVANTVSGTNSVELVRGNMADNDQFRILVGGTASNTGYVEIATADDATEPIYVRQYSGVFTSLSRTLTLLDSNGNTSVPGNLTVTGAISGSNFSGSSSGTNTGDQTTISGNAGTATVLQTARNINGTSFNGSANITTASWGTARTITIGSTGKSVDGSTNVSWSLAEIGAQAAGNYQPLDADLTAIAALTGTTGLLKKTAADTWTLDTTAYTTNTGTVTSISTTAPLSGGVITTTGTISLAANYGDTQNPYASKTANYFLAAPNGAAGAPVFRAIVAADIPTLNQSTTGNAGTATVLQTARTINGTSFNGSANITTASWGTARTITIGSTGKSVDGSGNVSWSLAEIGAQAAGSYLTTSTSFGGDVSGTYNAIVVADDSHNHSSSSGNFQVGGDLYAVGGNLYTNSGDNRVKIGFWGNGDTTYGIGMASGYNFGGLINDYALTFQMSNANTRGFWWGDSTHTNSQGAMALTTTGLLTIASGLRIGYGEADNVVPTANVVDVSGALKINSGTQSSKTSANSPVTLYTLAVSGTTNTCMVADYTVVNAGGTAQRSGTVTCNFNATTVSYTSTATPDLGTSTTAVTIAPVISSGSVLLRATITGSDTWNIKVSVRYF